MNRQGIRDLHKLSSIEFFLLNLLFCQICQLCVKCLSESILNICRLNFNYIPFHVYKHLPRMHQTNSNDNCLLIPLGKHNFCAILFSMTKNSNRSAATHTHTHTHTHTQTHTIQSGFSQMHKIGNIGINANFVFSYICSFLLYFYHMISVNIKLDVSGYKRITF